MGKTQSSKAKSKSFRNVPLDRQISIENSVKPTIRQNKRKREEEDDAFVDEKTAKKILREVEKQRLEIKEDEKKVENVKSTKVKKIDSSSASEDDTEYHFEERNDDESDVEVNEEQLAEFSKFENCNGDDLVAIMNEMETEILTEFSEVTGVRPSESIDPNIKQMYVNLGKFLSNYRDGQLPTSFNVISNYRNWEEFLELTKPEKWSAATFREATRKYISNLREVPAARFLKNYLLPRVRDDIAATKNLNSHLREAIMHALFKGSVFFEGFLFPLCESRTCTNEEAVIISRILAKMSIKADVVGAALIGFTKLPYSSSSMKFVQELLEKKHSLPILSIRTLADYFIRFQYDKDMEATVIWHQCLITFVNLWKQSIEEHQRVQLLELIKVHRHHQMSDVIRQELCAPQN